MSNFVEGGRPLLRGRLFGFPVHLDLSFVVIMLIIGYYPGIRPIDMVLWLLITPVAVLVHELGHAVFARAAGARPEIALAGFGGVTTFTPPHPLSRIRSIGISVAGPGVGLAAGLALIGIRTAVDGSVASDSWQWSALETGIFTCIAWSLLNLLPVLPLDGGQAMREFMPGNPGVRQRRATVVSVVVGAAAAVLAYTYFHQPFVALFMVFFAISNGLALRSPAQPRQAEVGSHPGAIPPERAVVALLWQGETARARELLGSLPPDMPVDLIVHGAVLALTGDREQGHALLNQEAARRPGDHNVAALLMLTVALEHDWDAVIATAQGPMGPVLPPPVIDRVLQEARDAGREDVAGRLSILTGR